MGVHGMLTVMVMWSCRRWTTLAKYFVFGDPLLYDKVLPVQYEYSLIFLTSKLSISAESLKLSAEKLSAEKLSVEICGKFKLSAEKLSEEKLSAENFPQNC